MAERRYKAVVIDLFDTLVTWNPDGLPLMQFRGREIRSTTPLLYSTLEAALGKRFDREKFSEAHASVYSDIFTERSKRDAVEITCRERSKFSTLMNASRRRWLKICAESTWHACAKSPRRRLRESTR